MVAATRQAASRNSLYLRNLPSANNAGRSANSSEECKNPDHSARCTNAPNLRTPEYLILFGAARDDHQISEDAMESIHSMCDPDFGACRLVEVKINSWTAGSFWVREASSCHFVRKEAR